jgi:tetratricopeptide (TPR) repeat protein
VASLTVRTNPPAETDQRQMLVLGKLMARQGALCSRLGLPEKARSLLQKGLDIFRRLEEPEQMAFTLNYLGAVTRQQGEDNRARQLWQESLAIYRELGDRWGIAWSLNLLGHLAGELGDYLEARQLLREGLTIHQEIGNQRGMAGSLNSLGYTVYLLGEYEEARPLLQEALAIRRELGYRRGIAISLNYLGQIAGALGKLQESKEYFYEALKIAMNIENISLALDILVGLAASLVKEGELEPALRLLQFPLHHAAAGQQTKLRAQRLAEVLEPDLVSDLVVAAHTVLGNDTEQLEETLKAFLPTQKSSNEIRPPI